MQSIDADIEYKRAKVIKQNATQRNGIFDTYQNKIDAIITSPPYLCMIDYTYGQRLSYLWLFPEMMSDDYTNEIGSRPSRSKKNAVEKYYSDMRNFFRNASTVIKTGGLLCMVLGEPNAKKYRDLDIIDELFAIANQEGFDFVWSNKRTVQWSRDASISNFDTETISVHRKS
jgi:tRNA G10  N-methylase Trm11